MDKIVYLNDLASQKQKRDVYSLFIDFAFEKTDYFMLVYVNYNGKGYTKTMKSFRDRLSRFKIKTRTNPRWPGTLKTDSSNTTYKIIFYKTHQEAREILKEVSFFNDWTRPSYPQDLAFFKQNVCWFYSVGHENISAVVNATDEELIFLSQIGLANMENIYLQSDNYCELYNESFDL